jgi:tRNA uridine 5-carboxymethylaminomethyl modification enzyme
MDRVLEKEQKTALLIKFLEETSVKQEEVNPILGAKNLALVNQSMKLFKIASRPQLSLADFSDIRKLKDFLKQHTIAKDVIEQAEIHLKYSGYIEKERNNADKLNRLENVVIPASFKYEKVKSLSFEATEKLNKVKPTSISQASRISGVSPSDISVLLVYMGR